MFHVRVSRLFLLTVISCSVVYGATPDELRDVRAQFSGGLIGEQENEAIHDRLQKMLKQDPDNPLLLVYFGSTETVMGKHAWMPWSKLGYVNDGIGHIDRALRLADQLEASDESAAPMVVDEVRLVAANTYVSLPEMFNTFDSGKTLLEKLLRTQPQRAWPETFLASLYSTAAKAAQREGDEAAQAKWQMRIQGLSSDRISGATKR